MLKVSSQTVLLQSPSYSGIACSPCLLQGDLW